MTLTTTSAIGTAVLGSLTKSEIDSVRALFESTGTLTPTTRFGYVGFREPHKRDVLAYRAGDAPRPERHARVILLDIATGLSTDYLVGLEPPTVKSAVLLNNEDGQIGILIEEYDVADAILAEDERWVTALAERGLTPSQVLTTALSAGTYDIPGEKGKRMIRLFAFRQDHPKDQPLAHPVDGLCAYLDLTTRAVTEVVDHRVYHTPDESGNYDDAPHAREPMTSLKPIEITQPEGPSFVVDGEHVEWANWKFDISYDMREGLILRQLSYTDQGVDRPVVYRASVAEMVVPYADPQPTRYWQNYFDTGEYYFGRFANSLKLGCDCLGEIKYFDATLSDELGNAQTIENAICMHEEDYGTAWKHTDMWTGSNEVRRQRRLVISFFTTIGNYDYGFYWYLYLDGTIECECKLTGLPFTSAFPPEGSDFQSELSPGLGAPYHQHLFNIRLDMMVDGLANAVDEVDAVRLPISDINPYGNAFTKRVTRLRRESEGVRSADATVGRVWHIVNTEKKNRVGGPTGYALFPTQSPSLLADPSSSIAHRAAFTTKELWVTQYSPDEQYPAGDLVNQSALGNGLPAYMAADRAIDGEDIVVWHTFGLTHFPRTEDWPVMPVDYAKLTMKPVNFFDGNPVMNIPATVSTHCGSNLPATESCHGD